MQQLGQIPSEWTENARGRKPSHILLLAGIENLF